MFQQFDYLQSVDSTSEYLKQFIGQGVPRVIVAGEQLAGKGRYGRHWHSPAGEGLYVSYLLYPSWSVDRATYLNSISALAVTSAIRLCGGAELNPKLKPPNDILIEGRKVSGVLTELGSLNDRITWAIIGIGVNLHQKIFPPELEAKATSLALQGLTAPHPLDFCETLTAELERLYGSLEAGQWEAVQEKFEHEHF
ncbi:MAG: biotin--[acetyl-CoA-carboxylase] ligase [Acidobacteriota bacterium]